MNRCDCFSWRHGVKLPGKKNGIPGGISQVPQDKWNHVSLSWYNQTAGSMTSQYLLHKTWFVCIEPEEPGRKFLQGMPPAAAPPRVGGWGGGAVQNIWGHLVWTKTVWDGGRLCEYAVFSHRRTPEMNRNGYFLITLTDEINTRNCDNQACSPDPKQEVGFGPVLGKYSIQAWNTLTGPVKCSSENLGNLETLRSRLLGWRQQGAQKGTPRNPQRLCFISA